MRKSFTRISFFVLTALLIGGLPNFMYQEAHAAVTTPNGACVINLNTNTGSMTITFTAGLGETDITTLTNTNIRLGDGVTTYTLTSDSTTDVSGTSLAPTVTIGALDKYNINDDLGALTSCQILSVVTDVGTDTPAADAAPASTADTTAPVLSSTTLNNDAKKLTLTFSEGVSIPTITGYTINGDGGSYTLTGGTVTGTEGSTSYTLNYNDADQAEINALTFDSTSTVTVAGSNVDDGDNVIAGATVSLTTSGISSPKNGSGCDGDCEEPTLGYNSKNRQIVENGFSYNGKSVDVERFFTPYPLISSQVGKQNTAIFKVYENMGPDKVKHFSFAYGLDKGQYIGESKTVIELDRTFDGIETVTVTDPENALDDVRVSTSVGNCNSDGGIQCLIITINHKFRAPLDFNIVATDVWDMKRNSWQNYYNHGIEVIGDSINAPKQYTGIDAGHIFHLTETSKTTAVDEFGNNWTFDYGVWMMDFVKSPRIQDNSSVFNRMHSDFVNYKQTQANSSVNELLEICPTCLDSHADFTAPFSYDSSSTDRLSDLSHIFEIEQRRATQLLDESVYDIAYPKAEIDRDDRPLSIILAEERNQKKTLIEEYFTQKQIN